MKDYVEDRQDDGRLSLVHVSAKQYNDECVSTELTVATWEDGKIMYNRKCWTRFKLRAN
jgi:hypothetical protein